MKKSAFTIIELLVVVSILAILSGMLMSAMGSLKESSKRTQSQMVLGKVHAAIRQFRGDMGFYPRGVSANAPLRYLSNGDIETSPDTDLPLVPADDSVWAPASTPSEWATGNGLHARLMQAMSATEIATAKTNAEAMRSIEIDRFYNIGPFGLLKDGTYAYGTVATPDAVTRGEIEMKRVMAHYRMAQGKMVRPATPPTVGNPWSTNLANATTDQPLVIAPFLNRNYQRYLSYARPRDASDAQVRAMRNGVAAGNYAFDSYYDASHAVSAGVASRTTNVATASVPWGGDYIGDLEPRYYSDVDGDSIKDILDGYSRPLVYINEGRPALDRIFPRKCTIRNFFESSNFANVADSLLIYHPSPTAETNTYYVTSGATGSGQNFITDHANPGNALTAVNAYDISLVSAYFPLDANSASVSSSNYIYFRELNRAGYNLYQGGDPYQLAGTLLPSRIGFTELPTFSRSGVIYFRLSADGQSIGDPFRDDNNSGAYDAGEPFIDRKRAPLSTTSNAYDDEIANNDIRLTAPLGQEREFELWCVGKDGKFHAQRTNTVNVDNLKASSSK